MNPEKVQFLSLRFLPGRLTVAEAAWYLGFAEHDISVLITHDMLTPLGKPVPNCTKYFAVSDLETIRNDRRWNDRATALLTHHWRVVNGRPIKPNPLLKSHVITAKSRPSRPKIRPQSR
jgi:hypothetical protein